MAYEFNLTAFFIGLALLVASVVFLRFHRTVADNIGAGVGDYDKFKLWAIIACAVGFLIMLNLHYFLINILFNILFGGLS